MADSNNIQSQINSVQADHSKWSAELMRLNGVLATAKGRVKTATKKAIKNAEQYLNDLTRRLKNLDADLSKAMKIEVKQKDDILLAEKGISGKGEMIKSIVEGATTITKSIMGGTQEDGLVPLTKKKDVSSDTTSTTMKPTTMYIIGGAILLVLLFMFKKK